MITKEKRVYRKFFFRDHGMPASAQMSSASLTSSVTRHPRALPLLTHQRGPLEIGQRQRHRRLGQAGGAGEVFGLPTVREAASAGDAVALDLLERRSSAASAPPCGPDIQRRPGYVAHRS